MVIQGIKRYAEKAAETAGPSLLETINEDINSGRYIPGAAATAPVPTQIQAMPVNLSVMSPTRVAQMAAPLASLQFPHHGTASADIQNRQGMPPLPHGMNLHGGKGTAPAPLAYEYQPTRSVATYPAVAAEENLVDNYQGPDEGPHVYGSPLQLISSAEKRKRAEGLLPGLKSARRDLTDHVNGEGNFMAGICDLSNVAAQHAANAPGEAAFAAADTLAALPYTRMNTPPDATLPVSSMRLGFKGLLRFFSHSLRYLLYLLFVFPSLSFYIKLTVHCHYALKTCVDSSKTADVQRRPAPAPGSLG